MYVTVFALQTKARAAGLWNLFMPKESDPDGKWGAGLSNVEYAYMAEEMGKSPMASEVISVIQPSVFSYFIYLFICWFIHSCT